MSDSDSDDDLQRAIALSLAEVPPIDPASSDQHEDDDLRRAIALSKQDFQAIPTPPDSQNVLAATASTYAPETAAGANAHAQTDMAPAPTSAPTAGTYTLAGLDRKAMEKARLERLGKRKRSPSLDVPSKKAATPSSEPRQLVTMAPSGGCKIQYANGVIKRTWANRHPRSNDVKIEEVLQVEGMKMAILSISQVDDRWLYSKLNPYKIKQIWFMGAKGDGLRQKMRQELAEAGVPNLRLHFPPMDGQTAIMHSKLMLMVYDDHLRVAIPTANMIKFDWGETNVDAKGESWQPGVMENTVFLIDLPRRPENKPTKEAETAFGRELVRFLRAQEAPQNVVEGVLKFDFSKTDHLAFVHSIPGSHKDAAASGTGLVSLKQTICRLKLDRPAKLELDYATSSLGALKEPFLKQLYRAASGLHHLGETAPADFQSRFRIYFPTANTVKNSTGGPECGGIITLSRAHYEASTFPKQFLRDYKSTRPGMLSHNKMLLARGLRKDGSPFAWAYVGSSNLTEAAWGSHKVLKGGKEGVLTVRNWECGVVMPVNEDKLRGLKLSPGEIPSMCVFEDTDTLEVPFQYPGEEHAGKHPWFFN